MSRELYFFDSWGALWCTCTPDHRHAVAFGPRGSARKASFQEIGGGSQDGETDYTSWVVCGGDIIETEDGWRVAFLTKKETTQP